MQAVSTSEQRLIFDTLIEPVQTSIFFARHWEREPLHIPANDRGRFKSLFSREDIDRLLMDYGRPGKLGIRLAKYESDRTELIDIASERSVVDVDRVFGAYCDGFTVNLNDVHERHAPIRELAISLADTFHCVVNVNAYLTPRNSKAFPLHFDTHSVLILQIEGTKSWRIYSPRFPFPTKAHKPPHSLLRDLPGAPAATFTLEAGDVLYVPRGFGHEASTDDVPSLHLTTALHAFTYFDLLEASLNILGWDLPLLRRPIPVSAHDGKQIAPELLTDLQALRGAIAEKLSFEDGLAVLEARRLESRAPAAANRFSENNPAAIEDLHLGSRVQKRPHTPCRMIEGCGWVSLQYPSHAVNAPLPMWPALEYIAQSEEFVVSSLPGHITDDQKVELVRRLVAEGLLLLSTDET